MPEHKIDTWKGCYPSNWKGLIVPKAMSHPAKFSSRLIRRIYEHMIAEGWLRVGDVVIDPFGGVALGGLEAMRHGLRWLGMELEAKFVDLGNQNIDLWNKKFSRLPHWGSARLLQGDSRVLLKALSGQVSGSLSSPPYADIEVTGERNFQSRFNPDGRKASTLMNDERGYSASVSSPPYNPPMSQDHNGSSGGQRGTTPSESGAFVKYGNTDGQLEGMSMDGFDALISSPPFRHSEGGTPEPKEGGVIDKSLQARHAASNSAAAGYGGTDGNLANMAEGSLDASISSPPFVNGNEGVMRADKFKDPEAFAREQMKRGNGASFEAKMRAMNNDNDRAEYGDSEGSISNLPEGDLTAAISSPPYGTGDSASAQSIEEREDRSANWIQQNTSWKTGYGDSVGQLSQEEGETFWSAARQIVEQVYLALSPGGHAVWVVKDYVKNKEKVEFSNQWRLLCESVGFVTLHEHHAELVHAKQHNFDGTIVNRESKSFFRRLAEKKGSPRIDYEVVLCMVKP